MKGQSLVYQFVLFFLIGFTIFLAVGNLFKTQSDIFKEDVAALSAKLTNSYLSSMIITTVGGCKQCDYVSVALKIPETYGGQYQEMILSNRGLNVSAENKYSLSSLHNLNSTFTLSGKSSSAMSKFAPEATSTITTFSDGSSAKNITITGAGSDTNTYIKIPKDANILDARISLNGYRIRNNYEQDAENSSSSQGGCANPQRAYDEIWTNYATPNAIGAICNIYENYFVVERDFAKNITITYRWGKATNDQLSLWIFNFSSTNWVRVIYQRAGVGVSVANRNFVIKDRNLTDFVNTDGTLSYYVNMTEGPTTITTRYYESKIKVEYFYPTNVSVDTANDGTKDIRHSGELSSLQSNLNLNPLSIQNFLSMCSTDDCLLPLNVSSDSAGIVELRNLKIDYYTGALKKTDKPITLTYNKNKNKIEVS